LKPPNPPRYATAKYTPFLKKKEPIVNTRFNVPILTEQHGPSVFKHKVLDRNKIRLEKTLHRLHCAVCNVVLFITNAADHPPAAGHSAFIVLW
jgi:hypothetical protein